MESRKSEYPEKTPGDELQKMPHSKARRFKPQARLEPAQQHWWQARKADVLTVTPRVAHMADNVFSGSVAMDTFFKKKNCNFYRFEGKGHNSDTVSLGYIRA